jgi:1,4-dihydroxy-2-naphthoyl-CoA hydrolase
MSIWFQPITCELLNKRSENTLAAWLDIQFTEITENTLTATMPASARTKQPLGIVHGGANVVLAETIASTAANAAVDQSNYYCVGLEINANHLRPVKTGLITATTRAIHLGRTTHVWLVELYNDAGKPTCVSRMTASVIKRP